MDAKNPRYFAQHRVDTSQKVGGPHKNAPPTYLFMHVPSKSVGISTVGGSKGWLFSARDSRLAKRPDLTGTCSSATQFDPGRADKQIMLRRYSKSKAYPNVFAKKVNGRNFVFFETADGKTIRPYVDEARQIVRYDQC